MVDQCNAGEVVDLEDQTELAKTERELGSLEHFLYEKTLKEMKTCLMVEKFWFRIRSETK